MPLLEVRDLNIHFRSSAVSLPVVSNLSFSIARSEIFGLAGESGCGKSITALSIMGILPENANASGRIMFKDRDLLKLDKEELRKTRGKEIAMVFQEPMTSLNPVLTVGYQIAEVLMTHKGMSKADAMAQAVELLRSVSIPSPEVRAREYPHQMSGGMRQRAMIAMAVACSPSLLIADEPTTALDVTIQAQILELIQKLCKELEMSILFITHDLGIIAENASRVGVMYAGRLLETGRTAEIFASPSHPYTVGLLESIPKTRGKLLRPIPGTVPQPADLPFGCKFEGRCRYAIRECSSREPDMEPVSEGHYSRCIRSKERPWSS